jgi:hypothetical protein
MGASFRLMKQLSVLAAGVALLATGAVVLNNHETIGGWSLIGGIALVVLGLWPWLRRVITPQVGRSLMVAGVVTYGAATFIFIFASWLPGVGAALFILGLLIWLIARRHQRSSSGG